MHQECESKDHIGALYNKLHEIDKRVTVVEEALEDLTTIKSDIHSIKELLEQGRGAIKFFQFLVWIIGPIVGLIFWWQEHVK
jgi:hypothetical protein